MLLNEGGGTFSAPTVFQLTSGGAFLLAGDFNGDGSSDLVTSAGAHLFARDDGILLFEGGPSSVYVIFNSCPAAARWPPSVQFGAPSFDALESDGVAQVTVTRSGNLSGETTVDYFTSDGTASQVSDYTTALGRLRFAPNEASKTLRIIVTDDAFVEPSETFVVSLANPSGGVPGAHASATVTIKDTDTSQGPNPITQEAGNAAFFVRQHYADFLGREPDAEGLQFWTNEITSCGADPVCTEVKRINVSAAFFLSIEFQNTGYLVERMYKVAYGDATDPSTGLQVPVIRRSEFLADTPLISSGVIVGQGDWQTTLANNKAAYTLTFVQRQRFTDIYGGLSPTDFVARLDANAGGVLSQAEQESLVNELATATDPVAARASVVRKVAENAELDRREKNRAFVLMGYFGYLRRNPNDAPEKDLNYAGWKFWLDKLNEFNGDYVRAEMVKAFLDSIEYRQRFGQ